MGWWLAFIEGKMKAMDALTQTLEANRADLIAGRVHAARLTLKEGRLVQVDDLGPARADWSTFIPGLVDAHVHIESSMLMPAEFGRVAVCHGTVATVSDPHEIANVLGISGIQLMHENAKEGPLHILFGAPACVPATDFESTGARLDAAAIDALFDQGQAGYLSEVMNFPGVLARDEEVMAKIAAALRRGLVVDGHAPGLRGEDAMAYAKAGITTDHECTTLEEALEKIDAGMHILIREGSAARDLERLAPLLSSHPERVMLCSDDKHPHDLVRGHIDALVRRAVALGHPPLNVLRAASLNPIRHYGLPLGLLQPGDTFDAVEVHSLEKMDVRRTFIGGRLVAEGGKTLWPRIPARPLNRWVAHSIAADDLLVPVASDKVRVMHAQDGSLITEASEVTPPLHEGRLQADPHRDLLLLACINRFAEAPPAVALIRGFGLEKGALASSVSHDSHNLIGVGASASALQKALQAVMDEKGGIAISDGDRIITLPLPVAGLMSLDEGDAVARRYEEMDALAKILGSPLQAPFMTLSFMALLVIPRLKLSDRGLFDGDAFRPVAFEV
jgi:adenine deaminase